MRFNLGEIFKILGKNESIDDGLVFERVSIDSRKIQSGDLFIALRGNNFDGNDFIQEALGSGAAFAVGEIELNESNYIKVDNSLRALWALAAAWRSKLESTKIIAITGSNGKTTIKNLLFHVLDEFYPQKVYRAVGNFNNHIGLPLSILGIKAAHRLAILEMGMNHSGELRELSMLARPNIALINNVGHAHCGNFNSLEEIASAKFEIIEGINNGTLLLNASIIDQTRATLLSSFKHCDIKVFGIDESITNLIADNFEFLNIRIEEFKFDGIFSSFKIQDINFKVRTFIENAIATIALSYQLDLPLDGISRAFLKFRGIAGRMEIMEYPKARIINDSYNANPDSVKRALDCLEQMEGYRALILGYLGELGKFHDDMIKDLFNYSIRHKSCEYMVYISNDQNFEKEIPRLLELINTPNAVILFKASSTFNFKNKIKLLLDIHSANKDNSGVLQ